MRMVNIENSARDYDALMNVFLLFTYRVEASEAKDSVAFILN